MKRFSIILLGALAMLMAGCSKDITPDSSPDPDAWKYDMSLPVPVEFGIPSVATKASYIKDLSQETKNFGVFGIDKSSTDVSSKQLLYNAPAVYDADSKILALANKTFYPVTNTAYYNFYAYYTSKTTVPNVTTEDRKIFVAADIGYSDILYGNTKVTNAMKTTVGWDGYNAKYIRSVNANTTIEKADYLPTINFTHVTSAIQFYIQTPSAAAEAVFVDNSISVRKVSLAGVPTKAKLCLVDLSRDDYESDATSVGNDTEGTFAVEESGVLNVIKMQDSGTTTSTLNLYPKVTPAVAGDPLFIVPQSEAISGTITMAGYTFDPIPFILDPKEMGVKDDEFKAGHVYNVYLTIHSPEKVTISVTVESWKDGFTGEEYDENNPGFDTELG